MLNKEKLQEKIKNYNQKGQLSKKQERKLSRFAQKMRREARRQHELFAAQTDAWIDEDMERRRIEEEVKREMGVETEGM